MPLHLLGKKSWNVYNPANIERVRADEAAAAALSAAEDQRLQEHEAQTRLALLRNETPPPPPSPPAAPNDAQPRKRSRDETPAERAAHWDAAEKKKRRKLHGEDDTDRDIRLAQQQNESATERRRARGDTSWTRRQSGTLEDGSGHIQLFDDEGDEAKKEREDAAGARMGGRARRGKDGEWAMRGKDGEWARREKNGEWARMEKNGEWAKEGEGGKDEGGMSFQSAFGTTRKASRYTNAFGREDPDRERRDAARLAAADPMAAMLTAQKRLKDVEEERKRGRRAWVAQREEDVGLRPVTRESRDERDKRDGSEREKSRHSHHSHHSRRRKHSDHRQEDRDASKAGQSSSRARGIQT